MPSKSKAQHNLMEAVAHSPGFAKKVGIPQSVGKHFHEADKMKKKKFGMGGMTGIGGPAAPGMQPQMQSQQPLMQSQPNPASGEWANGLGAMTPDKRQQALAQAQSLAQLTGWGAAAPGMQPQSRPNFAGMAPLPGMQPQSQPNFAGMAPLPGMRPGMEKAHFKKGGHVKHADELKGEAKETKSIAKEEMKALKRGHAPKAIMEHEKAEHKAMGYKKGGKIETPKKGFAMAESKGGRKPPHGKHTSEGDTKLKDFGMGKGLGHGRKVTKAATPKDEMPRKGFAMKKGGSVKKHEKHMARGGTSAKRPRKPKLPKIDPMALMAAGAPPAPMPGGLPGGLGGGAPMGGAPMGGGMGGPTMGAKKGGHVSHHHHHHYAKGGHIKKEKKEPESGPHMVRKVHEASSKPNRREDGVAQRGHTKGKQVKMASGGHVGSHPHRRADGIASKGHTSCKVC